MPGTTSIVGIDLLPVYESYNQSRSDQSKESICTSAMPGVPNCIACWRASMGNLGLLLVIWRQILMAIRGIRIVRCWSLTACVCNYVFNWGSRLAILLWSQSKGKNRKIFIIASQQCLKVCIVRNLVPLDRDQWSFFMSVRSLFQ